MARREDLTTDDGLRDQLLWARRGTALFARKLNELNNDDLSGPSLLPGWSRSHVVAHVGYNARAITRLMAWANTGVETPMYATPQARGREIELGATLTSRALRHLSEHASVALDVCWRDTPDDVWTRTVSTAQGRSVPASETVWMRTREVWMHAVDLDNGAQVEDIPQPILHRLLTDMVAHWHKKGEHLPYTLRATDSSYEHQGLRTGDSAVLQGTLAGLVRWASGRGNSGVRRNQEYVSDAPRWI